MDEEDGDALLAGHSIPMTVAKVASTSSSGGFSSHITIFHQILLTVHVLSEKVAMPIIYTGLTEGFQWNIKTFCTCSCTSFIFSLHVVLPSHSIYVSRTSVPIHLRVCLSGTWWHDTFQEQGKQEGKRYHKALPLLWFTSAYVLKPSCEVFFIFRFALFSCFSCFSLCCILCHINNCTSSSS